MNRILVAYDGSTEARHALEHAVNLAKETQDYELIVIYVVPTAVIPEFSDLVFEAEVTPAQARAMIDEVVREITQQGIKARGIVEEGDIADKILEVSSKLDCELIVIGYRKVVKIGRFSLGPVADKIARNADRAVLIVR